MANEYEYSGYESAFVPTPSESTNQKVERKTAKTEKATNKDKKEADQKAEFVSSGKKNILSSYRSYTYNFVLAALDKTVANNPAAYRNSELDLVILRSGGKGRDAIAYPTIQDQEKVKVNQSKAKTDEEKKEAAQQAENLQAISGFNKDSPGRFDMFIDDVEIDTIMAFSQQGGTTQPTSLKFEVIEPYSINGFLEALQISAVKAGYPNYASASFVLKLQFIGYKDDVQFPDADFVPKSERYFVFKFTGVEVEVTERGTKYRCSAVPFNETAYGQPGKLKKSVKMAGENVREILKDLMDNVTDQEKQNAKKAGSQFHDTYEIKFLKPSANGWTDDSEGAIAKSKLSELGTDSNLYQMIDPSQTDKKTNYKTVKDVAPSGDTDLDEKKFEPKKTVTQFPENVSLHEIIAAVIRDSEYVSNLIKDLKIDNDGMVDYFIVRTEVKNSSNIDDKTKKPYQTYTYVVTPYRIHYTNIPNLESSLVNEKKLKRSVLREYNYLYTGLNTDVRNFRLNFNFLYFEAIPQNMGNKDEKGTKTAARPGNSTNVKQNPTTLNTDTTVPQPSKRTDPTATSVLPPSGYNSALPKNDPYSVLARSMHEKVLNSTSLATAEIEILGDPFFTVTGGIGNYNPALTTHLETVDGEAAHIVGQVLIAINFRNPIDIGSNGMMIFDSNRIPFSGVFQVTTVKNTFKDGFFYQKLNLIRIPGQLIDQNLQPTDPADAMITSPNPKDQVIEAQTPASDFSDRLPNDRGLPSDDTNFTNATGGLGGNEDTVKNQSFGEYPLDGSLSSDSLPIGAPLPSDMARNIRLSQEGLAELSQTSLENSSKVRQTVATLLSYSDGSRSKDLVTSLVSESLEKNLLISNPGSGIGEGATVKITKEDLELDPNSVSYIEGIPSNLSRLNVDNIGALSPKKSNNILNNIGDTVKSTLGTRADPSALVARIGLDSSKVSGLGNLFQSKLTNDISNYKNVPQDVGLAQAYDSGLRLDNISASDLENLPVTQPKTSAPSPGVNIDYINKVVAGGGPRALANLYGVNDVSRISQSQLSNLDLASALENTGPVEFNPYSNYRSFTNDADINAYTNRVSSAADQLNPLTDKSYVKNQQLQNTVLAVFGSKALGKSPLDKLVNKTGNTNAPAYTGSNPIIRKNLGMPPLKS